MSTASQEPTSFILSPELSSVQTTPSFHDSYVPEKSLSHVSQVEVTSCYQQFLSAVYFAIPFIAGGLNPLGGAMNVIAKKTCGSVYFVVAIMYTLDSILCCLWNWRTQRKSDITLARNYFAVGEYVFAKPSRWFCLASGAIGAIRHVVLALVSATGGASVYTLGVLLGATVTGIVLDMTGFCWTPRSQVSLLLCAGGLAVAAGGILHSLPIFMHPTAEASVAKQVGLLLASAFSGMLMCLQAGCGNKLGTLVGGFRRALAWSFISGAIIMFLIGPYIVPHAPIGELLRPENWWKVSQAPVFLMAVASVSVCQRRMSGPMVYCLFMLGQLASSTTLDHFGVVGLQLRPINVYRSCGLAVVCCGVGLVTWSKVLRSRAKRQRLQEEDSGSV
eukprot:Blabericola_migrator_1__5715@NODE_28_length_19984_cov_212_654667_g25_i0_p8_GENE_NODE_28_length_19984_cov_212_654667_g25_i0NODE_28_length_19984_cov_212_654667_g25_i0_p8_ORF_typecomplete_len389_score43_12DMT_YdcZ/PF04657_13/5_4e09DMT_YdcZ/PF04657_13/2_4e15SLC3A2_N/PF16028_5/0_096PgaD/PF13994_6/3_3e03PgaD/PF13994_6/0_417TM_GPCR_Srh/PF10318_9/157TM_GPCR_Srh/PF10318_9/0_33_NODE_28_length_19984_cov_212_654667_g25_i01662117787